MKALNKLTPAEARVIVNKGTEPPFTGEYDEFFVAHADVALIQRLPAGVLEPDAPLDPARLFHAVRGYAKANSLELDIDSTGGVVSTTVMV